MRFSRGRPAGRGPASRRAAPNSTRIFTAVFVRARLSDLRANPGGRRTADGPEADALMCAGQNVHATTRDDETTTKHVHVDDYDLVKKYEISMLVYSSKDPRKIRAACWPNKDPRKILENGSAPNSRAKTNTQK